MERLKMMKEQLMSEIQSQMHNLENVDTKELGEAIDMLKDLEEAVYYCTITKAMEEKENSQSQQMMYYTQPYYMDPRYNKYKEKWDEPQPMMYYTERNYPMSNMRDSREGRSPSYRKMYMESKEMKLPQERSMQDLEAYMHELSSDITELINDATPQEKLILKQKLNALADKVV